MPDVQEWQSWGVGETLRRIGTPEDGRTNAHRRDARETFYLGRGTRNWRHCCAGCKGVLFPVARSPDLGQHAHAELAADQLLPDAADRQTMDGRGRAHVCTS